jgi:hypothetical protein
MTAFADVEGMRATAKSLQNGKRGDAATMSDALAYLLRAEAKRAETGWVTPGECAAAHAALKPRFGWPALVAYLATVAAVVGTVLAVAKG